MKRKAFIAGFLSVVVMLAVVASGCVITENAKSGSKKSSASKKGKTGVSDEKGVTERITEIEDGILTVWRVAKSKAVPKKTSKVYTNEELCKKARAYCIAESGSAPNYIEVDTEDGDMVTIHLYDIVDNHTATADWYTVDRKTAKGTDIFGNDVDLSGY